MNNSAGSARLGHPGWVRPARVMHDLQLRKVITSSSKFPFSQDSNHIPMEGSGYWIRPERGFRAGRVGWPGRAAYSCVISNFGLSYILRLKSDLGVLGLYGKPIGSKFQSYVCGGQWVLDLAGKGLWARSGRLAG